MGGLRQRHPRGDQLVALGAPPGKDVSAFHRL
jgi:hypothetical protein